MSDMQVTNGHERRMEFARCSFCHEYKPANEFSTTRNTCATCNRVYCMGYEAGKRFVERKMRPITDLIRQLRVAL